MMCRAWIEELPNGTCEGVDFLLLKTSLLESSSYCIHHNCIQNFFQGECKIMFPLSSPSSPAFSLSQHQGLFQWVGSFHQTAKVLELQLQHQSFQSIFRVDFLWDGLVWFPSCPRDSQESSPEPQFESIDSSVLSLLYGAALIHTYMTTGTQH